MGNAQSAESPRRTSQKLSKPKTGNHATAGLLSPGSCSNTPRHLSNATLPYPPPASPTAASTATSVSGIDTASGLDTRVNSLSSFQSAASMQKEPRRRGLFRSMSSRAAANPVSRNSSVGPSSRMTDRMPRASSMTYESAVAYYGQPALESRLVRSDSRASWNYNPMSYEAQRLLNLAEEPAFDEATATSESRMAEVTETTWKSSNPSNPPSAPLTRSNSDVSLYMPVRRRSVLQTPGVATRSSPPVPKLSFRHSHPASPCVSRQPSFESYRGGIMSMPPRTSDADIPRVVTPCDEQYRSIGTFKLGSLRITNGSPSPATPDVSSSRGSVSGDTTQEQDDYFPGADATQHTQSPNFLPEDRLPQSPIQSQPMSPLKTTSRLGAVEDQLFDDETQSEYFSSEVLDVRLDPNAKPPHPQAQGDMATTVSRTDSGFESTTGSSSDASHKPLTKADSGYSSNVSLRSFNKGQLPERETPPPVPPKDTLQHPPISRKPDLAEESRVRTPKATQRVPVPLASPPPGNRKHAPQTPGSVSSPKSERSISALSIGSGPKKPGRLQRFLSGARRSTTGPPAAYPTHTLEQSSIPPIPQDAEHKLDARTRPLPITSKRLSLKPHSSMDTLKTIFSVGSLEASLDAVNSIQAAPAAPQPEPKEGVWKQTLKSIARKPVPARRGTVTGSSQVAGKGLAREAVPSDAKVAPKRASTSSGHDSGVRVVTSASMADTRPRNPGGRTMSLTMIGEHRLLNLDFPGSSDTSASPLPSPIAKARAAESKANTFPRVNIGTQRPPSLRVPPVRSPSSTPSVSRHASRENLVRNNSMNTFHSYTPSPPSIADDSVHPISPSRTTMDPRRLQSFRHFQDPKTSPYNPPTWEPPLEHGIPHQTPQAFSSPSSRHNSITSVQSEGVYGLQHRGSSARGWQVGAGPRPLRHRASYDDYRYQQHHMQYGYCPSISNGYTASITPAYDPHNRGAPDAAATWSRSQVDAWYQDPYSQQPHAPRGHYRNRSRSYHNVHGPHPPYRVLHSYNSPAYRNAPIWG